LTETQTCQGFEEDLSALLDDELAPERAAELRDHVAVCAGCRELLGRLVRVDSALSGAPARPVPASLRARLEASLAADRQAGGAEPRRAVRAALGRRPWRAVGGMAALAAGVAIYFAFTPAPAPPPLDLQSVPEDELGLALEIDTVEDLDVIGNLELLELVLASESG
jgi:anti-sigma factor RsiW